LCSFLVIFSQAKYFIYKIVVEKKENGG